jgi:transitional endoplasmic reticulum ATPase
MAKEKTPPQVIQADVPRIIIPDSISFREAQGYCEAKADEQESETTFVADYVGVLPWVGAYALDRLLAREYSASLDSRHSAMLQAESSVGRVSIPWGAFLVHGIGIVETLSFTPDNCLSFRLKVSCKRKLESKARILVDKLSKEIEKRELYAGCALLLSPDPTEGTLSLSNPPKVLPIPALDPASIILNADITAQLDAELFGAILSADTLAKQGIPTRRGIMLAGRPGTGKTLSARVAASLAIRKGWTVFYLPDARGLEAALRIAAAHSPALLICEDIDRQLGKARDALCDRILNALDGLDRSARVVFVATSNDPSNLPAALLRPGRLDSIMQFEAPDQDAAYRLLSLYLPPLVESSFSDREQNAIGLACAGLLAAAIREVAVRSVLHATARARHEGMSDEPTISAEDVLSAALSVRSQQRMLERAEAAPKAKSLPTIPIRLVGPADELTRNIDYGKVVADTVDEYTESHSSTR